MMAGDAALHWLKYSLGFDAAHTQTSEAERQLLARYAMKSRTLLEIGAFEGVTTRALAEAMPESAELFAVDPFFKGRLGICWAKLIASTEATKARRKRVFFVEALSEDAARKIDVDFDFIFVDADHSLNGIRTDWRVWSPRCRFGGVMAFHDTRIASHAPYVQNFGSFKYYSEVISMDANFDEIDHVDTLSVFRRVR